MISPYFVKKISIFYCVVLTFFSSLLTFLGTSFVDKKQRDSELEIRKSEGYCKYNVERLQGYSYVKPLMFVDDECEGDNLAIAKQDINAIIDNYKTTQGVLAASVYLRDFNSGSWTAINDDIQYEPGSLFKVPILIAYLKMNEIKPGTLDKELLFNQSFAINKNVAFSSKSIQLGRVYKIKELLRYMISYSDNNATALLNNNLKPEILTKLFADLNLDIPDIREQHYYFTAKNYSLFMRAIYNASYLSIDNSEFAAELLGTCNFNGGIVSGIPTGIKIAHKFGESGTPIEMQLHESAIVYIKDKPYLLTIMTKGKDNTTLLKLISEISSKVYSKMASL